MTSEVKSTALSSGTRFYLLIFSLRLLHDVNDHRLDRHM